MLGAKRRSGPATGAPRVDLFRSGGTRSRRVDPAWLWIIRCTAHSAEGATGCLNLGLVSEQRHLADLRYRTCTEGPQIVTVLLAAWLVGALLIVLLAWMGRKLLVTPLTMRSALVSVGSATLTTFFLWNFMGGDGSFERRAAGLFNSEHLGLVVPQGLLALFAVLLVAARHSRSAR